MLLAWSTQVPTELLLVSHEGLCTLRLEVHRKQALRRSRSLYFSRLAVWSEQWHHPKRKYTTSQAFSLKGFTKPGLLNQPGGQLLHMRVRHTVALYGVARFLDARPCQPAG